MKKKLVVVELLPNRIDVMRVGGRRGDSRRIPLAIDSNEARDWVREVRKAGPFLRSTVKELAAEGAGAIVLYRSPTHAIDIASLKIRGAEAREAAKLECLDALSHAPTEIVCTSVEIGHDGDSTHVVAAADRDDIADTIVKLVEDAGLHLISSTPMNAAMLAGIVREVLKQGKGLNARLYVGEHGSYFVVVDRGKLVFARQVTIGMNSIAASLERQIQRGPGQPAVQLDAEEARRILHEHGRPGWDAVIDPAKGLTGEHVGPVMQPVLQRFVVELRQSLRFGMTAEQRDGLSLLLTGPGSSIPGFAALVGEELSVPVEADPAYRSYDWAEAAGEGTELRDAAQDLGLLRKLSLLPLEIAEGRADQRLRRWLWTGAAAAVVVLAVDGARLQFKLADARRKSDAVQTQVAGREQLASTSERLIRIISSMNRLQESIELETAGQPSYRAVLHELASLTPRSVQLTAITLDRTGTSTYGTVAGFANAEGTDGQHGRLERLIDLMAASPLMDEVTLGSVQLSNLDGRPGEEFTARFRVLRAPDTPADGNATASVPTEAAP